MESLCEGGNEPPVPYKPKTAAEKPRLFLGKFDKDQKGPKQQSRRMTFPASQKFFHMPHAHLNAIDLGRNRTRNLEDRRPALYRLRYPARRSVLKEKPNDKPNDLLRSCSGNFEDDRHGAR
ncbi:hypothetical protein ANN_08553 [Periplaneta americana]|uniref:Uncharacterized protein n=1 Tax=Periplaneta americana TaxID=6978 RepID=A0ABQ8T1R1_PERAM|nr:hypothetical protein ANN_08553 [Periplaneta americana]